MSKKYNINDIYTTKNQIKITIDQTGSKAMAYLFHIEQLEQSQAEGNIDER